MAIFTNEIIFTDANDLPSSGWLTALGILFLIGTIFQELVGINFENSIDLVGRGADLLSIYMLL